MNPVFRHLGRLIPRNLRNWFKSPSRTLRWWILSRQPDVTYAVPGGDCSFRCPPLAVENAFRGQFEDPEQTVEFRDFLELIRPIRSPLFFDLGTHFGLFSHVVMARSGGEGRAIAVDPAGTACSMVRRIASLNGWTDRLTVIQAAMGGESGEVEMVDGGVLLAGYFMEAVDQPQGDRIRVPRVTIDELVHRIGCKPDLIKIDIEGFERDVFEGATETLTGASIPVCLEIHNRYIRDAGGDPAQLLEKLRQMGYTRWTAGGRTITAEEILVRDLIRIVIRRAEVD